MSAFKTVKFPSDWGVNSAVRIGISALPNGVSTAILYSLPSLLSSTIVNGGRSLLYSLVLIVGNFVCCN